MLASRKQRNAPGSAGGGEKRLGFLLDKLEELYERAKNAMVSRSERRTVLTGMGQEFSGNVNFKQ